MKTVKVFQIGLGDFGRHGFEHLVEISREFDRVELCGVCDRDLDRLDRAEKFAEANGIDVETFQGAGELYSSAKKESDGDAEVMVYDAGPADTHANNIYRSMQHDFFHLAEKPPSMNRGEHIKEKRLAEQGKAMWKCDFIERESPVVKKAIELLDGKDIESIEVFRESSVGIEKALDNFSRLGVKGGDILDKMVHEVYVLDMIEASGSEMELELQDARPRYFQPRSKSSESFVDIYSGKSEDLNYETSTAMTKAEFKSGGTDVKLHSSWMGLSEEAMLQAQEIEESTGHRVFERSYAMMGEDAYVREEARFFVIKGERDLVGDMLHGRIFDLDTGEEIETSSFIHDQLHRVIEKAVFLAQGRDVEIVSGKEIDVFMNAIFDVKESIDTDRDYFEELSRAQKKLESMTVEATKSVEIDSNEAVAG